MRHIKIIAVPIFLGAVLLGLYSWHHPEFRNTTVSDDPRNSSYIIEGQTVTLVNGIARSPVAPGSATEVVTRYFGNELATDLDGDGDTDYAFILTQERGGSGTFYYAVAAVKTQLGYLGTDGYLLGDRIAPQSTNLSTNVRHKYVIAFNYADRAPGEPMTAQPSIGKSVYLKLDIAANRWGIVDVNFSGE